jgi:hypothetical protein
VIGLADFNYNWAYFGDNSANPSQPGFLINYSDTNSGALSTITFGTSGTGGIWQWEHYTSNSNSAFISQMTLSNSNILILWNPTVSNSAGITLNPAGTSTFANSITVTGTNSQLLNQQITGSTSILTKGYGDSFYLPISSSGLAVGNSTYATGSYSVALGVGTQANGYAEVVVGQYNVAQGSGTNWIPTDDLFTVGNGTSSSSPSDAFVVKKSGDTTIGGNLAVNGNTALNGQLYASAASTFRGQITAEGVIRVSQQGDLSMGNFTAGGFTTPQSAYNKYIQTLSSSGVALSSTESANMLAFLNGLDQIVGLDNVVECWSFRSTQNVGAGATVYGIFGKYNGSLINNPVWSSAGMVTSNGNQHCSTLYQQPGTGPFALMSVLVSYTPPTNYGNRWIGSWGYGQGQGIDLPPLAPTTGWAIAARRGNSSTGIWVHAPLASTFPAAIVSSWDGSGNSTSLTIGLNSLYSSSSDGTTQTLSQLTALPSPSYIDLGICTDGDTNMGSTIAFSAAFTVHIDSAKWSAIYSLYKSTIGQGLGLP